MANNIRQDEYVGVQLSRGLCVAFVFGTRFLCDINKEEVPAVNQQPSPSRET